MRRQKTGDRRDRVASGKRSTALRLDIGPDYNGE
jgi:hypothetical protein